MRKIFFLLLMAIIFLGACDGAKTTSTKQVANLKFNAGRNKDFHVTIVNKGKLFSKESRGNQKNYQKIGKTI